MHDRDLRDAGRRQARLVGEASPAVHEDLGLVHQVRAAGLDQRHQRQLVLARDGLRAQRLLQAHRGDRAALDRAVACRDQDAPARHDADADDGAAALDALLAVVVVHAEPGERAQLEKVAARIEQPGDALAGQQLSALLEPGALRRRLLDHPRLERADLGEARLHPLRVRAEGGALGIQLRVRDGHYFSASGVTAR